MVGQPGLKQHRRQQISIASLTAQLQDVVQGIDDEVSAIAPRHLEHGDHCAVQVDLRAQLLRRIGNLRQAIDAGLQVGDRFLVGRPGGRSLAGF